VTAVWAATVVVTILALAEDAYSETPGMAPVFSERVVAEALPTKLKETPPTASRAARKKALDGFRGLVTFGLQVTNRDTETDASKPVVRIDFVARVRVIQNEDWQPRVRGRAQFGGMPTGAVDLSDPTTFKEFAFDGGVFERLAPGLEFGVGGGVSSLLKTSGEAPALEGPARWRVALRLTSDDESRWLEVSGGQDQRLPREPGWNGSACVGLDAGIRLDQGRYVDLSLVGDLQRSVYSDGALTLRLAVVGRFGTRS